MEAFKSTAFSAAFLKLSMSQWPLEDPKTFNDFNLPQDYWIGNTSQNAGDSNLHYPRTDMGEGIIFWKFSVLQKTNHAEIDRNDAMKFHENGPFVEGSHPNSK